MKFKITYPGFFAGSKEFDNLEAIQGHRIDAKGRVGTVTVEMSETEYVEYQRQLQALQSQHEKNVQDIQRQHQQETGQLKHEIKQLQAKIAELEHEIENRDKRLANMSHVINRWKSKAEGKPVQQEPEIIRVERVKRRQRKERKWEEYWQVLVHQRIPNAPSDPSLWQDAWAALGEDSRYADKLYYDGKSWVVVLRYEW